MLQRASIILKSVISLMFEPPRVCRPDEFFFDELVVANRFTDEIACMDSMQRTLNFDQRYRIGLLGFND
jgi:hypothetical protein